MAVLYCLAIKWTNTALQMLEKAVIIKFIFEINSNFYSNNEKAISLHYHILLKLTIGINSQSSYPNHFLNTIRLRLYIVNSIWTQQHNPIFFYLIKLSI